MDMYEYWLDRIPKMKNSRKILLEQDFGSAQTIYENRKMTGEKDLINNEESRSQTEAAFERLQEADIRFVTYKDPDYPQKLKEISSAPYAIYVKGGLPDPDRLTVAIVGARRCSNYGETMALEFASALASHDVQIISGMARGIDGAGQRGALNGKGNTYAVLGSGVDICYPREHIGLYMDIQKTGGVLSEYPPGTPALKEHFPARNRLISGMADVLLVMEARERSGSLITVERALDYGKDVYALPGPVTSDLSRGCNRLIREGAGILLSPEEFLADLRISDKLLTKNKKNLETKENLLYSVLDLFPKSIDQLMKETGMSPEELLDQLIMLQLEGTVKEVSKNHYARVL